MKKGNVIQYTSLLCVLIYLLTSCGNLSEVNMSKIFFDKYIINDTDSLDCILNMEYSINDLQNYFKGTNMNENIGFGIATRSLSIYDVDKKFPIEVIRSKGYSVYNVIQGGRFYVFWVNPLETDKGKKEPTVYFTAYFPYLANSSKFNCLKKNIDTATRVKEIDPSFELNFLNSTGIFSYSLLNDKDIMQVEYFENTNIHGYDDLVVKEVKIVSKKSVHSRYSSILSKDIF